MQHRRLFSCFIIYADMGNMLFLTFFVSIAANLTKIYRHITYFYINDNFLSDGSKVKELLYYELDSS